MAGMAVMPGRLSTVEYPINAGGKVSGLCTSHPLYRALGSSDIERQANYRGLVAEGLGDQQVKAIRLSLNKGIVLGNERFADQIDQIAALTGKRLASGKPGRSVGWRKK